MFQGVIGRDDRKCFMESIGREGRKCVRGAYRDPNRYV